MFSIEPNGRRAGRISTSCGLFNHTFPLSSSSHLNVFFCSKNGDATGCVWIILEEAIIQHTSSRYGRHIAHKVIERAAIMLPPCKLLLGYMRSWCLEWGLYRDLSNWSESQKHCSLFPICLPRFSYRIGVSCKRVCELLPTLEHRSLLPVEVSSGSFSFVRVHVREVGHEVWPSRLQGQVDNAPVSLCLR